MNKKIAIISTHSASAHVANSPEVSGPLCTAADALQVQLVFIHPKDIILSLTPTGIVPTIVHSVQLEECDSLYVRNALHYHTQAYFLTKYFEERGKRVLYESAIFMSGWPRKWFDQMRLQAFNWHIPTQYVCSIDFFAYMAAHNCSLPLVLKPYSGSQGEGVQLARTMPELQAIIQDKQWVEKGVLVQPYLDIIAEYRVLVLNGTVIAAAKKTNDHDFRKNASLGATFTAAPLELFKQFTPACVFTGLYGLDVVHTATGDWKVIEINRCPGWKALQPVTTVNIAEVVLQSLLP